MLSKGRFFLAYRSGTQNVDPDELSRVINPTERENVSFQEILKAIVNSVLIAVKDRPLAESLITFKSSNTVPDDVEIPKRYFSRQPFQDTIGLKLNGTIQLSP